MLLMPRIYASTLCICRPRRQGSVDGSMADRQTPRHAITTRWEVSVKLSHLMWDRQWQERCVVWVVNTLNSLQSKQTYLQTLQNKNGFEKVQEDYMTSFLPPVMLYQFLRTRYNIERFIGADQGLLQKPGSINQFNKLEE